MISKIPSFFGDLFQSIPEHVTGYILSHLIFNDFVKAYDNLQGKTLPGFESTPLSRSNFIFSKMNQLAIKVLGQYGVNDFIKDLPFIDTLYLTHSDAPDQSVADALSRLHQLQRLHLHLCVAGAIILEAVGLLGDHLVELEFCEEFEPIHDMIVPTLLKLIHLKKLHMTLNQLSYDSIEGPFFNSNFNKLEKLEISCSMEDDTMHSIGSLAITLTHLCISCGFENTACLCRLLLNLRLLRHLHLAFFSNQPFSDEVYEVISKLTNLKSVSISDLTTETNDISIVLTKCVQLESLYIKGMLLNTKVISSLSGLSQLKILKFCHCEISDENVFLSALFALPKLQSLAFINVRVSDNILMALSRLELQELTLYEFRENIPPLLLLSLWQKYKYCGKICIENTSCQELVKRKRFELRQKPFPLTDLMIWSGSRFE